MQYLDELAFDNPDAWKKETVLTWYQSARAIGKRTAERNYLKDMKIAGYTEQEAVAIWSQYRPKR